MSLNYFWRKYNTAEKSRNTILTAAADNVLHLLAKLVKFLDIFQYNNLIDWLIINTVCFIGSWRPFSHLSSGMDMHNYDAKCHLLILLDVEQNKDRTGICYRLGFQQGWPKPE